MLTPSRVPTNVTTLPRGGRDGFIADTAVRLDRLEAAAARLERDNENARSALVALLDSAEQAKRLRTFEDSLRNSREYKLDEILRATRDLKDRLDRLEGKRSDFEALPHTSFEAVNNRLQELGRLEVELKKSETRVKRTSHMLYACAFVSACTLVSYFAPALT